MHYTLTQYSTLFYNTLNINAVHFSRYIYWLVYSTLFYEALFKFSVILCFTKNYTTVHLCTLYWNALLYIAVYDYLIHGLVVQHIRYYNAHISNSYVFTLQKSIVQCQRLNWILCSKILYMQLIKNIIILKIFNA